MHDRLHMLDKSGVGRSLTLQPPVVEMSAPIPPGSVLITGPTGGLGSALLRAVASRAPAHLFLLGRRSKQFDAATKIAKEAGAKSISAIEVELADLDQVSNAGREVAAQVSAGKPPLSTIICSAGMQAADRRQVNVQGLEKTFAVNVLATHLLLRAVLSATSERARVVLVGSGTHFGNWHSYGMVPAPRWLDPSDLATVDPNDRAHDSKAGGRTYSTTKLGVLYLAHAWQARHDRLRVNVFDPGLMPGTGLARSQGRLVLWMWKHIMPAFTFLPGWSTPRRSAKHLAALALGEQYGDLAGGYDEFGHVRKSSDESYNPERETRLWEFCEAIGREHPGTARINRAQQ